MITLLLLAALAAPSNFKAIASTNTVALTWSYSNSGFSNFQIDRMQSSVYVNVATPDKQSRSYLDSTVQSSTTYSYRIKAVKGNQSSPYVFVTVTTDTVLPTCPVGSTVVKDTVWIKAIFQVSDPAQVGSAAEIKFLVNGSSIGSIVTLMDWPAIKSWDTTTYPNGCYQLGATAQILNLTDVGMSEPIATEVRN